MSSAEQEQNPEQEPKLGERLLEGPICPVPSQREPEPEAPAQAEANEVSLFIQRTYAKLREQVAALEDPERDPVQMLDIAIAAWQIVTAVCDNNRMVLVVKNGVVCGIAQVDDQDRTPEEA